MAVGERAVRSRVAGGGRVAAAGVVDVSIAVLGLRPAGYPLSGNGASETVLGCRLASTGRLRLSEDGDGIGRFCQFFGSRIRWGTMDYDVIGAAVAVVGVLLWIHRDFKADIRALNVRIDNILVIDRAPKS